MECQGSVNLCGCDNCVADSPNVCNTCIELVENCNCEGTCPTCRNTRRFADEFCGVCGEVDL
jgi:hypothetical protein